MSAKRTQTAWERPRSQVADWSETADSDRRPPLVLTEAIHAFYLQGAEVWPRFWLRPRQTNPPNLAGHPNTHGLFEPESRLRRTTVDSDELLPRMPRAWYRGYFTDHPAYIDGNSPSDVFTGHGRTRDKVKVWCTECYNSHLAEVMPQALRHVDRSDPARFEFECRREHT